jgi:hypothetical protein
LTVVHADAAELVLGARLDPGDEERLGDGQRLEDEPPAGPQRAAHAGERAHRVVRRQIAEAVAPAQDGVEAPEIGQLPQIAGEEARPHSGPPGGTARALDLARGQVDAGHRVPRRGQADRQPTVAARHVKDRGGLRAEQLRDEARVVVGHGRAGRPPEAGGEATVKVDVPVVRHPLEAVAAVLCGQLRTS